MNHISYLKAAKARRNILGLDVCEFDWSDALSFANEMASLPIGQTVISFLNANNANLMYADAEYREVLSRHVIFPDGIGVDIASQVFYGKAFPANLNGTDFVPALMTYIDRPKRVGLVGAAPGVAERAVEFLKAHTPWHEFFVVSDGFFDEKRDSPAIARKISDLKLDILLVALGSSKQEKWVDRYVKQQHARLVLNVGALFDFMAGGVPRAPDWVRSMRLEWAFRLYQEPSRLWRRYIIGNPAFMGRVVSQFVKGLFRKSSKKHPVEEAF